MTDSDASDPTAAAAVSRETAAAAVFGDRLPIAVRYAELLAGRGVDRGLLGPREADRVWDRHLLNCAVLGELVPRRATVIDVGSGAGLPGLALALARPDLTVELVEPLLRRASFLTEVVAELGLITTVTVTRARAEELAGARRADLVTARAVAPLPKLVSWCLPLTRPGGSLLALKGSSAAEELAAAAPDLPRAGAQAWSVLSCGHGVVAPPTTVVRIVRAAGVRDEASRVRTQSGGSRRPGRRRDRR
jgi:16S rRNA (guanine527-N7)-methyltransferase